MTSVHGYWTYLDIIQSYDLPDLRNTPERSEKTYEKGMISHFLKERGYSIMLYLLQVSNMDTLANESQFNTTLMICDDKTMLEIYGEEFFMNLDRNTARRIVNIHSIPRIVTTQSLLQRRVAVLDTKDPQSQLSFTNNRGVVTIISSRVSSWCRLVEELKLKNGIVMVMDGFFIPENFNF